MDAYIFFGIIILIAVFIVYHHFSSKKRHNETKAILTTAPDVLPVVEVTTDELQEVHDRIDGIDNKWDEHKEEVMDMLEEKLGIHIEKWEEMGKSELVDRIEEKMSEIEDKMEQHRIDMEAHRIEMAEHKEMVSNGNKKQVGGGKKKARSVKED